MKEREIKSDGILHNVTYHILDSLRAREGKFAVDLYPVLVDLCSIFIGVFNSLISVFVFILSRGLNRGMLRVKRTVHYY